MTDLLILVYEFFKTGLFSVGGGLATLPFLFKMADKYPWFNVSELTSMIAVSESTPGPIGVNMATYAGFSAGGVLGGIVATLALIAPSVIVILIVASILEKFRENIVVKDLFYGIRPAVVGLLTVSVLTVFYQTFINADATGILNMINYKKAIVFAVLVFLVFKFKKHPIFYIVLGAVAGIVLGI